MIKKIINFLKINFRLKMKKRNRIIIYFFVFLFVCQFLNLENSHSNQPTTIDSRIKTYIYNPNEVFPIVLHYGYHTHIDFPSSEYVKNITVGNPVDWEIETRGSQIFLQTHSKSAHTNMTVVTSKRTYEFDLIAKNHSAENDFELAYAVKFFYPEEGGENGFKFNYDKNFNSVGISDLIRGKINANYVFYGKEEISPSVIFNDSRFTYIKLKKEQRPKIKLYDKNNRKLRANIFLYNDYIVIDKILVKIKLVYGNECVILVNKNLI